MSARAMLVTRTVTRNECPWLDGDIAEGELLYECRQATYGCVAWTGVAATRDSDGGYPFFEVPRSAVRYVGVDS